MVNKALLSLPWEQREVVVLRVWHGMKLKEIAALQGVPLKTAISRYHYTLVRLKKELIDNER